MQNFGQIQPRGQWKNQKQSNSLYTLGYFLISNFLFFLIRKQLKQPRQHRDTCRCSTGSVSDPSLDECAILGITGRLRSPYCTNVRYCDLAENIQLLLPVYPLVIFPYPIFCFFDSETTSRNIQLLSCEKAGFAGIGKGNTVINSNQNRACCASILSQTNEFERRKERR
jgi:hypothetical protein